MLPRLVAARYVDNMQGWWQRFSRWSLRNLVRPRASEKPYVITVRASVGSFGKSASAHEPAPERLNRKHRRVTSNPFMNVSQLACLCWCLYELWVNICVCARV